MVMSPINSRSRLNGGGVLMPGMASLNTSENDRLSPNLNVFSAVGEKMCCSWIVRYWLRDASGSWNSGTSRGNRTTSPSSKEYRAKSVSELEMLWSNLAVKKSSRVG